MTDPTLDLAVCRCPRCIGEGTQAIMEWPDWAPPPVGDWRQVETIQVVGGRL